MSALNDYIKVNLGEGKYIIIVRHGEAWKNRLDIHGGDAGTNLTPEGIDQMKGFAKNVAKLAKQTGIKKCKLFCSASTQVIQSRTIIEEELKKKGEFDYISGDSYPDEMAPIDLGVAGGKSNKELERIDPEAYEAMEAGRRGEMDIQEMYEHIRRNGRS